MEKNIVPEELWAAALHHHQSEDQLAGDCSAYQQGTMNGENVSLGCLSSQTSATKCVTEYPWQLSQILI